MFFACGIWCLADISSVSPSSEPAVFSMFFFQKTVFFKASLPTFISQSPSPGHFNSNVETSPFSSGRFG